jgi:HSP20 family protein
MTLIKRNTDINWPFRGFLSDFFDTDETLYDRLIQRDRMPSVNVAETEKEYEIEMAAPGMKKSDFKVNVSNGVLTISAEKEENAEEQKKNYTRKEYSFRSFSRSFTLPDNTKDDSINAKYTDGVLKLTIAKKEPAAPKAKEIAVS